MEILKRVALILTLILILKGCTQKNEENDWAKDDIRGKVKSFTESSYEAIELFGNIEKGELRNIRQKKYNENGYEIEENTFNTDGSLDSKGIIKYDEKGNIIEKNSYGSDHNLILKIVSIYDEKGNMVEMNSYGYFSSINGTHTGQWTYKYDEKGNQIEQLNVYEKLIWTYKYDEKGNKIEYSLHHSNGNFRIKETNKYDKVGNLIENNVFYTEGSLGKRTTFKYDKKANKTEEFTYNSDGSLDEKETFNYDDKGNLIEEALYDSNDKFVSTWNYKYDYDKKGNWIKKISSEDEKPKYIREREYEYYD